MNLKTTSVLFTLILGSFIAPVSGFEELGEVSLEPMEKPSALPFLSGTEVHWLKEGEEAITYYYESVDADMVTVRRSDGCIWTSMTYMFAPTLKWSNCYGTSVDGTQEIIETKGSPWPLSDRTEFQYTFTGKYSNDLGQWQSTRTCKVDKPVRVKVPAGEYDTFKLVCENDWNKRTYWISPELGYPVAFEENHKIYISRWHVLELVKVVNP